MARDFDGADDQISFGSDASIDDFAQKTISFYLRADGTGSLYDLILGKGSASWGLAWNTFTTPDAIDFYQAWSGANDAQWQTLGGEYVAGQIKHVAVVWDNSLDTNTPTIYIAGVAVTVTLTGTTLAPADSDAANSLVMGQDAGGGSDLDGAVQHFAYANALWTAEQVNRARWWGRPGGALAVYHPFVTDKLANEGTATANGTATGTTVASLVTPVQRPGMGTAL